MVRDFAARLDGLIRAAALASVQEALGTRANGASRRAAPAAASRPPSRRAATKKGQKRDPRLIAKLTQTVGAHVKAHPGQGIEAMAKALGVKTGEITLPIAKLLKNRTIRKTGQKRATKYYPR